MAGIGFVLRRLTRQDNLVGMAQGYLYSALITSGPFLVTVLAMGALNVVADRLADRQAVETFRLVTIYNFSLSLLTTGPFLLVMTRYLADRIYEKHVEEAPGMLLGGLALTYLVQMPLVFLLYFHFTDMAPLERIAATLHFYLISSIWVVSIFLSALKDYRSIGIAFAAGMGIGLVGGALLIDRLGAAGMLFGFGIGMGCIFFALSLRVMLEYPFGINRPFAFLAYFRKYWELAVFGLAYNMAIWIDKLVLWTAPDAVKGSVGLISNPTYDSAMFLAHVTTVPALAVFVVNIETVFFERYQKFYRDIQHHATFADIQRNQANIIQVLGSAGRNILILQSIVATLAILGSPALLGWLRVDATQIGIFRLGALGSLFQILLIFLTIVLAYFDLRWRLMQVSLVYVALNGICSWATMQAGFGWYGYGFFIASLGTFLFAFAICAYDLNRLPYLTFIRNNLSVR